MKPKFETGTKVICKDPVFLDEEVPGFVAKQLEDDKFLVRLDRPFRRPYVNDGKSWLKVSREYGYQVVREVK